VAAIRPLDTFPLEAFAVDALLCAALVAASRLALRLLPLQRSAERRRVLIVGAGRSGRALARELKETPDARVVGFLDDNPAVRRRRVLGVKVLGGLGEAAEHIGAVRPDQVLVTIPGVDRARLDAVVSACADQGVECHVISRAIVRPTALTPTSPT
jgi:FlaA1/EpsC-like NDP-sugar epimerase